MKNIGIIIAGGVGSRMGFSIPKQFALVDEKPIIIYTLEAFERHPNIDGIVVVCIEGWHDILRSYCKQYNINKVVSIVNGGSCGQESIKCGLDEANRLYGGDCVVLVHDANRPMISESVISDNIITCNKYGNATAVVPCTTVVVKKTTSEYSSEIIDRDSVYLTQTPHSFILKDLLDAHKEAKEKGILNTVASCSLYVELGRKVYYSIGSEINIKLTRPDDIEIFKALLANRKK